MLACWGLIISASTYQDADDGDGVLESATVNNAIGKAWNAGGQWLHLLLPGLGFVLARIDAIDEIRARKRNFIARSINTFSLDQLG